MNAAVTNSTCLIGLERIQRLNILPQVFSPKLFFDDEPFAGDIVDGLALL